MNHTFRLIAYSSLCTLVLVDPILADQTARSSRKASSLVPVTKPSVTPLQAKLVTYDPQDLVSVRTRVRFVTLIVLPDGEEILEIACGDKDYWSISGTQNLAYVKPAQEGIKTNLNIVTASGHIYSFVLSEVSGAGEAEPDLKVVIVRKESPTEDAPATGQAIQGTPAVSGHGSQKFVSVREFDELRHELQAAQEDARKTRESTNEAIAAGVRKLVSNLRFAYRFEAGRKPFYIRGMGHDERFTYIHARPEETPTLYEIKDGKPNLVTFSYEDGVFVVSKILDNGYLAIGKQRLPFVREE